MVASDCEVTPGGFQTMFNSIGSSNPFSRSTTTSSFIDPPWTSGTFGSTTRKRNGASFVTTTQILSTDVL